MPKQVKMEARTEVLLTPEEIGHRREIQRKYRQSEKGKAAQRRWYQNKVLKKKAYEATGIKGLSLAQSKKVMKVVEKEKKKEEESDEIHQAMVAWLKERKGKIH